MVNIKECDDPNAKKAYVNWETFEIMSYRSNRAQVFRRGASEHKKNKLPDLKKIDDLPIEDLKKIKQSIERFQTRQTEYERKFEEISRRNDNITSANQRNVNKFEKWQNEYSEKFITPLEADWGEITTKIHNNRTSVINGIFTETKILNYWRAPSSNGRRRRIYSMDSARLPKQLAERFGSELDVLEIKLKKCAEKIKETHNRMLAANGETIPLPNAPNTSTILTISGMKVRFSHTSAKVADVDRLIRERHAESQAREAKREEEIDALKARAASNEKEVRNQTEKYKKDFAKQKQVLDVCPYCGTLLVSNRSHLDHIIPVSKGGRAYPANLVFVCSDCNQRKSNATLAKFIIEQNLDLTVIYSRLEKLKKEF